MTSPILPTPAELALPAALVDALHDGVVQLRPVYAAASDTTITDFAFVRLNPAARRLLGLPGQPAGTLLAPAPGAPALLALCQAAWAAPSAPPSPEAYQDASGGHWRATAQRQEAHLVLLFTQVPTPAAPRYEMYEHAPAAICVLRGPQHAYEYCNVAYQELFPGRPLLGRGMAEALPELVAQGFLEPLNRVYATGATYASTEVPLVVATPPGSPPTRYVNFTYQPYREQGQVIGITVFAFDVTEQVLAHRAHEAQWGEWQRLFGQAPVAIAVLQGPHHVVQMANAAACAHWGLRPAQVLGRPLREALPPALHQELEPVLTGVLASGKPHVARELPTPQHPPGHQRQAFWDRTCQPYYDLAGRPAGITLVATDVSQQVAARRQVQELNEELHAFNEELSTSYHKLTTAQHELHLLNQELAAGVAEAQWARAEAERQRQRLERLFRQSPVAICILDGPELVHELVNPVYQQFFPGKPLLGLSLAAAHPGVDEQAVMGLLRNVYDTGGTYEGREVHMQMPRAPSRQLEDCYFDCLYQARRNEHGAVDGVLIFATEVTAQVLARQQVQQLNHELETRVQERTREAQAARAEAEAQRRQLQAIIQQAPVPIGYVEGPELRLIAFNATAGEVWGCLPHELLGRPLLEALPQLQGKGFDQLLHRVVRTRTPLRGQETELLVHRAGKLETGYFNFVYQPVLDEQNQVTGVLTIASDVTEQVLARRQVQRLNQELECRVAAGVAAAQRAQATAERQRQRLERFFEQAPAAVCVFDGPNLVFELVNPGLQRLFHTRPLLGLPLLVALPELAGQPVWQQLQRVYATGETHEETRARVPLVQQPGGPAVEFYFQYVQQARYDEHGRIDGVLLFALDITAQVRVQQHAEALQVEVLAAVQRRAQERETYYQVFAQTPAVVALMYGPEFRCDYVNEACVQLFPGRELRGRRIADALPETVPQGFFTLVAEVYATGEAFSGTELPLTITQPTGPPLLRYFNFTYQAYRENGVIMGVSVFGYDVSEQVRARQEHDAGLARMQTVFEQAPVALALLAGPTYVVEVANPAICAMWGRSLTQVLGQPLFSVLPEVIDQGYSHLLDEVRRTGVPFVSEGEPAQLLRHGALETIYFNFVYQPLADELGQVTAVVIVATDVSQRQLARQQLAQANAELRTTNAHLTRTNADLDNFIYTASHDLKAPITNIESLLLLLRKQLPAAAQQAGLVPRVLEMMQSSIERFQLTIAQLTDLSRLQQAYAEPAEPLSLAAVVEAVRLDLAPEFEATAAQLTVDVTACATVSFAPQHLRSVVYNLLSNAVKYHQPGRPPQVRLRCHSANGTTLLEVQDNGLGLSEQQQGKLFGLFQRLHAHVPGSGVGLYMVKRIVENAGGTVTVQSQLGVGSTFIVALPHEPPALLEEL
ncbi:PAS domain-containing protein [Hymenobacter sp. H14-R3]|uniref:PAS domain-containing protein n=1 Tax=Hymenobacter sp. H14-R3 TaxID=3046308 RepID=UPI0024BBBEC9|nr:PAS domain-containing protein [Hymenobacter sp. H14-R3]MDJ0366601.1 PAS domain-containing protein [Hymenobacter sp. H14-R3]